MTLSTLPTGTTSGGYESYESPAACPTLRDLEILWTNRCLETTQNRLIEQFLQLPETKLVVFDIWEGRRLGHVWEVLGRSGEEFWRYCRGYVGSLLDGCREFVGGETKIQHILEAKSQNRLRPLTNQAFCWAGCILIPSMGFIEKYLQSIENFKACANPVVDGAL